MKGTRQDIIEENTSISSTEEIDLLALFGILFRYKWWIIIITAVAAVGVVAFSILTLILPPERNPLPNVYKPSALILLNEESGVGASTFLATSGVSSLASLVGVSTGSSYGLLAERLLKSKSMLDNIVKEFKVVEKYHISKYIIGNARRAVLARLSVSHDAETSTLTIAYEDYDPAYARDVVNRLVELIDKRFSLIGGNRNLARKDLLEQKLVEVEVEIAKIEAEIQSFQNKYGTLDVESLAREQITAIAQLRSQLILKDMEIKTYSSFTLIDDPVLKRMKAERDNLAALISEMESGYSEYESKLPAQDELPRLALEFEHMRRNLEVQVKIYEILTQEYELAKLNVEGDDQIFQVLELAEAPDLKAGPRRSIICFAVTLAAFLFSIIFVFILNAAKNVRKDPERIKKLRGEI